MIRKLIDIQYTRNDMDFHRGTFRVRGDVLEIFPAYSDSAAYRVEFFGDEIDRIVEIDTLTGEAKLRVKPYCHLPGIPLCCAEREDAALPRKIFWKN